MRPLHIRLLRLMLGFFLYALGIVFTINANIGYAPWEVFHVGISKTTGVTIGVASIVVGAVIVAAVALLGEKIGLGTIGNMIFIGIFIDITLYFHIIPVANNLAFGIAMLFIGMYTIAVGSYFYIDSAFGAGPRDSLMVAVARKTGLPVGICRGGIEMAAALAGWLLGGMVGIGTVITVFAIGFCVQTTFKAFRFDPKGVKHETLGQMVRRKA